MTRAGWSGFAHAGFGPNAERSWISAETGVICVVVTDPKCAEAEVAAGLLDRCEEYLRRRGAKVLYGGGLQPLCPFYIGLYGGSELPGVLDSDTVVTRRAGGSRLSGGRADRAACAASLTGSSRRSIAGRCRYGGRCRSR